MRLGFASGVLSVVVLLAAAHAEEPRAADQTLNVWPGIAPGEAAEAPPEKLAEAKPGQRVVKRLSGVTQPTLAIFEPPADKRNSAAVVICPGGGYNILAYDLEGEEVAQWLNTLGITGIVLKYRVPPKAGQPRHLAPLQDAQRAMSLVRSKAAEWKLDPKRIGILGFSAGGHLAATTLTNDDQRAYDALDDADKESCRPDFAVLVYPAYLAEKDALKPEIRVTKNTPPTFLAHAGDDNISAENSLFLYLALKRAGVPAELHIYEKGGHGYGLRPSSDAVSTWPARCEDWFKSRGLLVKPN